MKVEIGGGPSPQHTDWIQFDAQDWKYRTGLLYVLGDARKLPWDDETVEEIFASNILEHFSFLETKIVLLEWRRVLMPNGKLTVIVPDLLGVFNDFIAGINPWVDFVERVYGSQTYSLDLHRAGFTKDVMPEVFRQSGLSTISCESTHAGGGITIVGSPI